ncbi:hypothetical protein [Corynebacterium epidermidicanis]|uniref:Secreted protein n=1 Tax=Corynebacterium epidermidicanis TaxID=1050174 RepID=A0A0G3GNI4_9CORY|nr:hypothetical protein [Corynebacterium epidermidicanis]AKK02781.1 hypothetical protein CEPID_04550 [Corynebacterium epidermidicanis]
MRRLSLTALAVISICTLSGCGAPSVLDALPGSKETPAAAAPEASDSAPTSEKKSTSKPATSKSTSAPKSEPSGAATESDSESKSKRTEAAEAADDSADGAYTKEIDPEQQKILKDALVPIIKEYAENPETDTVTGQIRFDKDMKPNNFSKFTVNGKPFGIDGPVRKDAEKALAPLADTPESERFSKLEFKYSNNILEAKVTYR